MHHLTFLGRPIPIRPVRPGAIRRGVAKSPRTRGVGQAGIVPVNVGIPNGTTVPGGPGPGLSWYQFMWKYISGPGLPLNPGAAGIVPPGQPTSASGVVGTWVQISNNQWNWFPPGISGTPYGYLIGGDGATYDVYTSSDTAASDFASSPSPGAGNLPAPPSTPSPYNMSGSTMGQWSNPHPDYWIWIPVTTTMTAAVSGMSTGEMLLLALGGLIVIGGVGYLLLD